jgi:hypothetical protein
VPSKRQNDGGEKICVDFPKAAFIYSKQGLNSLVRGSLGTRVDFCRVKSRALRITGKPGKRASEAILNSPAPCRYGFGALARGDNTWRHEPSEMMDRAAFFFGVRNLKGRKRK